MEKINFEDLPSTNTPYNADTFNTLQNNAENAIEYSRGETITINPTGDGYYEVAGCLTNGTKDIRFTVFTPKSLEKISNIILNSGDITVRHASGIYLHNHSLVSDMKNEGSFVVKKVANNCFSIVYQKNTTYSATNNSPVAVELLNFNVTFN